MIRDGATAVRPGERYFARFPLGPRAPLGLSLSCVPAGVQVNGAFGAAKAEGDVKADVIPAGEVVTTTHIGPYANLNVSHQALWSHIEEAGLTPSMPVWEIFVDDPTTVPEDELKTLLFRKLG